MLEFIGIGIGERVADLGAGAGYSIELLARAVGSSGVVYSRHDPRTLIAMPSEPARARPAGDLPENLVLMQTPYDAPFMAEAKQLDLVTLLFAYHELMASKQTRKNFNLAVFRALKPGRSYVIAGHAPTPDEGAEAAQRSGRVAESIVKADVEAAGFSFVESADFLSSTARAGATSSATAPSQYLLKFRKPK